MFPWNSLTYLDEVVKRGGGPINIIMSFFTQSYIFVLGDTKLIFRFTGELGEKKGVGRNKNDISILIITLNHRQ